MRALVDFHDNRMVATAAFSAAQENRFEAVRLLHELRAEIDKPVVVDEATPAFMAAQFGHTTMVQLLYGLGADVHRARNDGRSPIHAAALRGYDKTMLLLLSLRGSIGAQDNEGRTPWQHSMDMPRSYGC